ncbi:MAG: MFS transporter [Kangiellaceae bacterium]
MSITFILSFSLLIFISLIGFKVSKLPKNVWLLFVAQPLGVSSASMVVLAGGLLGGVIAPSKEYATIPVALMISMTAIGVFPAAFLMKKYGRRIGTMLGLSCAVSGALVSSLAAAKANFSILLLGTAMLGFSMAFVAQMRFAVIESLKDPKDSPKAISILMIGAMFAAVLGPEMAVMAKEWIDSPKGYAGSFIGLSAMVTVSILLVFQLDPIGVVESKSKDSARKLTEIMTQPIFIIAVTAGTVAYGVMSYVMTASPLSMHNVHGHDLESTKWVIQSHIIAMYLPSLFSAFLIQMFGLRKLMAIGTSIYLAMIMVALMGHEFMYYWMAMVLLGIGWNFLFTSGTILLPESYKPSERFKVQATNDFTIFFVQALGSLSAGWVLFSFGWDWLIQIIVPIVLLMFLVLYWFFKVRSTK